MESKWPTAPLPEPSPPQRPSSLSRGSGKRIAVIGALLVVIAGLTTTAGLVMVNRGNDADAPNYVVTQTATASPVFEPRDSEGDDAFFPLNLQVAQFRQQHGDSLFNSAGGGDGAADDNDMIEEAIKTGLFGGTAENTCDPERLITFLYDNPDKGRAWADAQGIQFNELGEYIRSLEVRVLAEPATILNFGYNQQTGTAYEVETVLDAGTAVLVDEHGDIRTRCYCGNPTKPKPPMHRPPRCLILTSLVYTTPGGKEPRSGASSEVVLTGQAATGDGPSWSEIAWGDGPSNMGWTPDTNLRLAQCPPPIEDPTQCADLEAPVWAGSEAVTPVGRLGGEVRTATGSTQVQAPVSPAGGENGALTENGSVLIDFTTGLTNSAWVQTSDLQSSRCEPVSVCVNTEGPVRDRVGGFDVRPGGTYHVTFTGHFAASPVSSAEIRFSDGSGQGWISNFYTPVPDSHCDDGPDRGRHECVVDAPVWQTPTSNDDSEIIGLAIRGVVTILDDVAQDGRLHIQMGPGGPTGWIDTGNSSSVDRCVPRRVCSMVTDQAWTEYPTSGDPVAGTPSDPQYVNFIDLIVLPRDGYNLYAPIVVDGEYGWISEEGVAPAPTAECDAGNECQEADSPNGCDRPDPGDRCAGPGELVYAQPEQTDAIAFITDGGIRIVERTGDAALVEVGPNGPRGYVANRPRTSEPDCGWGPLTCHFLTETVRAVPSEDANVVAGFGPGATFIQVAGILVFAATNDDNGNEAWSPVRGPAGTGWLQNKTFFEEPTGAGCEGYPTPPDACSSVDRGRQCCVAQNAYSSPSFDALIEARPGYFLANGPLDSLTDTAGTEWIRLSNGDGDTFWAPIEAQVEATLCRPSSGDEPTPTPTPTPRPTPPPAATPPPQPTPAPQPQPTPTTAPSPTPESCPDADGDEVCDQGDNCRDTPNQDQADADGDGKGDACDPCTDVDQDLHCSETDDNCPNDYDPALVDTDKDGIGDVCDNCPYVANQNQADSDGDGAGNACEGEQVVCPQGQAPVDGVCPPIEENQCPAGQVLDRLDGTGECYPNCAIGVITSGGYCCAGSWDNDFEIERLGCYACPEGYIADYSLVTRECTRDPNYTAPVN